MRKSQLVSQIINQLQTGLPQGVSVDIVGREVKREGFKIDIEATLNAKGKSLPTVIGVKDTQSIADIREAARRIKEANRTFNSTPTIAGRFLGERARQAIKEEGVALIDLAGNFCLNKDDLYIEKIVDKNPFTQRSPLQNLFAPVSSRITRSLLLEPERVWSQQELAKETDVSLGQTNKVIRRMIKEEFVKKEKRGGLKLQKPGELLDEWAKVYPKDKNQRLIFYSFEKDQSKLEKRLEKASRENNLTYALGYFSGALKVAPFIHGFNKLQFFIRSQDELEQYQKLLDLSPAESGGNVEIFVPDDKGVFYKLQKVDGVKIVSNIQLYIDLINYHGRGKEQAQHLRERMIKF